MIEGSVIIRNRFRSVDSPLERPRNQSAWMRLDVVEEQRPLYLNIAGQTESSRLFASILLIVYAAFTPGTICRATLRVPNHVGILNGGWVNSLVPVSPRDVFVLDKRA